MTTPPPAAIREASRKLSAKEYPGTIRAFFPFWDAQYRPFLVKAVEALPADRFDWKPTPEAFSASQIVVHIAECERGWVHGAIDGGAYEEWVVPHEDPAQGWQTAIPAPDHAALLDLLERWHRPTQEWLDRPVAELDRVIVNRPPGIPERRMTLHWILALVQQHEIHHRAQLIFYFRLMGLEPPPSM